MIDGVFVGEKAYLCGKIDFKMEKEKEKEIKREEVVARWEAARERKRACLVRLEKSMREAYKKKTGVEATRFFAI